MAFTAQTPAERRLRLHEAVSNLTSDIVIITEATPLEMPGPQIVYVNLAFAQATGLRPADVIGQPARILGEPETGHNLLGRLIAAGGGGSGSGEVAIRGPDGRTSRLELQLHPVSDGSASTTHFVAVGRELTEQDRSLQERAGTDRLLASVFAVIDQGVSIVDEQGRVILINPAYTRLFGWRPEDLVGQHFGKVMQEDVRSEIEALHERAITTDAPYQVSHALQRRDGSVVQVRATCAVVMQPDGRRYRVASILPTEETQAAETVAAAAAPRDFEAVTRAQLARQDRGKPVVAGKLRLVGLEEVKQATGTRWPKLRERTLRVATGIIRKRLSDADVFSVTEDDGFVICFADLDEEAAAFKAKAVADEIRATLIGELGAPEAARITAHAAAIPVEAADVEAAGSIAGVLEAKLEQSRREIEKQAYALLRKAVETAKITLDPVFAASGQRSPIVLTQLPNVLRLKLGRVQAALADDPAITLETDLLVLGLTTAHATAALHRGANQLYIVPVDCDNFLVRSRAEKYLQVCRAISDGLRQHLLFELRNLPAQIYQARVAEFLQMLAPFARGTAVEVADPLSKTLDMAQLRVSIVTVDARCLGGSGLTVRDLGRFAAMLHTGRSRLLVKNVSAAVETRALRAAGVDLLAGPGIVALPGQTAA